MNNVREFEQLQDKINLHVLHKKKPNQNSTEGEAKGTFSYFSAHHTIAG